MLRRKFEMIWIKIGEFFNLLQNLAKHPVLHTGSKNSINQQQ